MIPYIVTCSDEESVCSSVGSLASEPDESLLKLKRELRTLGSNMQQAQRRETNVINEQMALKRPHEESIANLKTIIVKI